MPINALCVQLSIGIMNTRRCIDRLAVYYTYIIIAFGTGTRNENLQFINNTSHCVRLYNLFAIICVFHK